MEKSNSRVCQGLFTFIIIDGSHSYGGGNGGGVYVPGRFPTFAPGLVDSKGETNQLQSADRVRTEFPETWLWSNATVGYVNVYVFIIIDGSNSFGGGRPGLVSGQTPTAAHMLMPGSTFAPAKFNGGQLQTVSRVRTEFPETWLWSSASVG